MEMPNLGGLVNISHDQIRADANQRVARSGKGTYRGPLLLLLCPGTGWRNRGTGVDMTAG
jgi:hypothetical protein